MMDQRTKRAREQWKRLQEIAKRYPPPFEGMTKEQVIRKLRETREQLWEEKLAASFRHK